MGVCKTETTIVVVLTLNVILLLIVAYFLRTNGDNLYGLEKKIAAQEESIIEAIKAFEAVKVVETVREVQTVVAAEPTKTAETTVQAEHKTEPGKPEAGKPAGVSPQLIAAISGAIAVILDDENMERHTISSIQPTP